MRVSAGFRMEEMPCCGSHRATSLKNEVRLKRLFFMKGNIQSQNRPPIGKMKIHTVLVPAYLKV